MIISNNAQSGVLQFARTSGVPARRIGGPAFAHDEVRDTPILDALREHRVDLVLLLGYMKLLGPRTTAAYRRRIVNTHPALLPKYGGKGMYGERVHEAVLAAGDTEAGATVHLVDEEYDHGEIVAQWLPQLEARPVKYALILIGLLLTLPAAVTSGVFGPTTEDAALAVTPAVRLPLDALKRTGSASVIFEVPAGVQWTRIRDEWGDPDYLVFGVAKSDGSVVSWSSLGVAVTASIAGRSLPVEPAAATAYGYSSNAQDPGVVIRPGPGARVLVDFAVSNRDPGPATEIVVQPDWPGMKDRFVGVALNLNLRPHIRVASICGVLLLALAAFIKD